MAADLLENFQYGLSSSGLSGADKTVLLLKLTDPSLKCIEQYQKLKVCMSFGIICFESLCRLVPFIPVPSVCRHIHMWQNYSRFNLRFHIDYDNNRCFIDNSVDLYISIFNPRRVYL